jgi:transposase InsO family protein
MKYDFIDEDRSGYGVAEPPTIDRYCEALDLSVGAYYQERRRREHPSARTIDNDALRREIEVIYQENDGRYGYLRVTAELKRHGRRVNRKRVHRLMRSCGLYARRPRKIRITTRQDKRHTPSPNLLAQNFGAITACNDAWLSDMTYIYTDEGVLFLTVVLDMASREILGWSFSETLEQDGVWRAIMMALGRHGAHDGQIFHSDRGSQYTSRATRALLGAHGIRQSMSGTGNCYDNAPMESFFKTLKYELVHYRTYHTRDEARQSIVEYIEEYYNYRRLHSALGYHTPREWRLNHSTQPPI